MQRSMTSVVVVVWSKSLAFEFDCMWVSWLNPDHENQEIENKHRFVGSCPVCAPVQDWAKTQATRLRCMGTHLVSLTRNTPESRLGWTRPQLYIAWSRHASLCVREPKIRVLKSMIIKLHEKFVAWIVWVNQFVTGPGCSESVFSSKSIETKGNQLMKKSKSASSVGTETEAHKFNN